MTMRTRSVCKAGIIVLISIYSASSVKIAVSGRRNHKLIRHSDEHQEEDFRSSRDYNRKISRSLGVGMDNLRYENTRGQYHIETRGKDNKGKGKGINYSDNLIGKGKGASPSYGKGIVSSYGKGSGKGSVTTGNLESEDIPYLSSTEPPSSIPTFLEKNKAKNQKKEHGDSKKGKHSKLRKSDKELSFHPNPQPTRIPTASEPTTSPPSTWTDDSNTIPTPTVPTPTNSVLTSTSGDILVSLTPYTILYVVADNQRPPFRSELLEVIELTRIYLDRYFSSNYEQSELTNLSEIMTIFTKTAFESEEPTIEYESKAILEPSTVIVPEMVDLDNILVSAFEGENLVGYIGLIQSLPPSNMFSSVEQIKLIEMVNESRTMKAQKTSRYVTAKSMTLGAIAFGGVAGLVLIFASSRLLHRRPRQKGDRSIFRNQSSSTNTGETFATRSRQDNQIFRPICDELYDDAVENRR
mmetsp:Transcript_17696/g.40825  ORF Transcript_17696/g.40825 Transcript_17696/m.40825 type:complete len:467 (+) Transcript_17696:32-1432(+)